MSKYPFFAKKGRPSGVEREVCRKINDLINSSEISKSDIDNFTKNNGVPETQEDLETLYLMLTGEEVAPSNSNSKSDYESLDDDFNDDQEFDDQSEFDGGNNNYSQNNQNIKMTQNNGGENPINFSPFEEPVIERNYTKGFGGGEEEPTSFEEGESNGVEFEEGDMARPIDEDIPEPEWAEGGGMSSSSSSGEETYDDQDDDMGGDKLGGDNLEDLSPAQKRKSAEKTAEAILNMYCNFAPMPFKRWASISDTKVQKLVFDNKIDLKMNLENNVSVKDYIDGVNEQVDDIFKVSEDTRNEIKDPLIDVLLEQELALTPTQRLLLAVGSHVVTMGFSAYQLAQNNKMALESFEKYHQQTRADRPTKSRPNDYTAPTGNNAPTGNSSTDFNMNDKEQIEKLMREMESENDIIDADNDPNIEVTEDYD
jgi:hypothetical protein